MLERLKIRVRLEARIHGPGGSIKLAHGLETQDQLDRPYHAGGRVEARIHDTPPRVRTDDEGDGAVCFDMVRTVLRIVLDYENGCIAPELAVAYCLDEPAQGQIIV